MSNRSRFYRYIDVLIRSRFGFGLPVAGMWNYAKYFFVPRRQRIVPVSLAPVIVMLYTTFRCNLKCPFCSATRRRQPENIAFTIGGGGKTGKMGRRYAPK